MWGEPRGEGLPGVGLSSLSPLHPTRQPLGEPALPGSLSSSSVPLRRGWADEGFPSRGQAGVLGSGRLFGPGSAGCRPDLADWRGEVQPSGLESPASISPPPVHFSKVLEERERNDT